MGDRHPQPPHEAIVRNFTSSWGFLEEPMSSRFIFGVMTPPDLAQIFTLAEWRLLALRWGFQVRRIQYIQDLSLYGTHTPHISPHLWT